MATDRQSHWQNVYTTKGEGEVSWFQDSPQPSLDLIALTGAARDAAIVDIGGGAARLVDALLDAGYSDLTVLDLSEAALATARARLGAYAEKVQWVVSDVTVWQPQQRYDVWHDRAALHFLTAPSDQRAYVDCLTRALRPGGHAIVGTFALDGPEKSSGLPVVRHDAASLGALLGDAFTLIDTRRHEHMTPWGAMERFQFSTFRFG
jgi:SAM-dependent methyltransferase